MVSNFLGSSQGVSIVDDAGTTFITSEYNSGVMTSDIKGAFLSDTNATNVTGSELIVNGTFDSDTSWVVSPLYPDSQYVISGGTLRVDSNTTYGEVRSENSISLVVGDQYVFSANVIGHTDSYYVMMSSSATNDNVDRLGFVQSSGTGTISYTFTAPASTMWFWVACSSFASSYIEIDNISLRKAEEDRSVNNKGLQVFGTITKSPVATGAELVGYSGWSSSNYLQQPYNSDFLFGTDDFCITGWINNTSPSNSVYENIITFGNIGVVGYANREPGNWLIQLNKDYGFNFYYKTNTGDGSGGWSNYNSSSSFQKYSLNGLGIWYKITIVKSGDRIYSYANDDLLGSNSVTGSFTTSSNLNDMKLTFGYEGGNSYGPYVAQYTKAALWRISRSAPSSEQVKKMYEDEKVLFQENAACTLYGTSDAVTALAYDETTELLHVGTSSGRSEFKGLRRVDNTTTPVTTTISASNGLVAEQ